MKQTASKISYKESDPYAWIVLRLPKKLWVKAQILLEHLKNTFRWKIMTGEMQFDDPSKLKFNKYLKGSNVVQIIHHALDSKTPEPVGYKIVFPYLVKGCTPPHSKSIKTTLHRKKKSNVKQFETANFAKDKMLWEIENDSEVN